MRIQISWKMSREIGLTQVQTSLIAISDIQVDKIAVPKDLDVEVLMCQ